MPGIDELIGASGVIEQLLLWGVVNQVITSLMSPAFNALQQDALKAHPNMVITPDVLAKAVSQTFMAKAAAQAEAAKSGVDASRFDVLLKMAEVRLSPAELAEAVLRSYEARGKAEEEARLQGITPERFRVLELLAGDGIGPQQAAEARRRGIIEPHGRGPESTSYDQAIAESRLHDKWGPVLFDLTRALLSPQAAAEAVVRGFLPREHGASLAALSGVGAADFAVMVNLAGDAPSPTQLSVALRRGIIPLDSGNPSKPGFVQGIEQGRLANKWTDMFRELAQEWPTPADALEARLVGQIDTAESKKLFARFGGDPEFWQLLFNTRGEAPTPLELGVLANRGDIKWEGLGPEETSFSQGFHEGRWRNKWEGAYRALAKYRMPESTIVTLLSHGVIDDNTAIGMLSEFGMTAVQIRMYLEEAHTEAFSDYRGATVTMVLEAYHEQIITAAQALPVLEGFHVTPQAAKFMLDFTDARRAFAAVNNALTRIRTLYANRKITVQTVRRNLADLGIAPASIEDVIKSWQIENSVSVKVLTEAQIADAWHEKLLTDAEALTELENIGYTPFDAWLILSLKAKAPIPGRPSQGPAPPQGQVIPGTT
jgi:hypothetical protein